MTEREAFEKFSRFILSPKDLGVDSIAGVADFAIGQVDHNVRLLAEHYISSQATGSEDDLSKMWWQAGSRIGPAPGSARRYTNAFLSRLRDQAVASRPVVK